MIKPKGYVNSNYLRFVAGGLQNIKQRSYTLMQINPGQKVLDVGCGPASDTIQLARLVGQTGQVFGVDYDQAMIDEAEKLTNNSSVAAWVKYKCADSNSLPFENNYFNACRSERLFQHLTNPERTLSEMVRVTKTGGRIVVLDTDYGSISIDTTEVDIERRLARVHAEKGLHNGYSGRQLYRLFRQQHLSGVNVELHPVLLWNYSMCRFGILLDETEHIALIEGIITEEELQRWHTSLEQASSKGTFFCSVNHVMAIGCKS